MHYAYHDCIILKDFFKSGHGKYVHYKIHNFDRDAISKDGKFTTSGIAYRIRTYIHTYIHACIHIHTLHYTEYSINE